MPRTRVSPDLLSNTSLKAFSFTSLSASIPIAAGDVVVEAKVVLTTAFNGSPSGVFSTGSGTALIPSGQMSFSSTDTYICQKPFRAVAADTVSVVVSATSPTQGSGFLIVVTASPQ